MPEHDWTPFVADLMAAYPDRMDGEMAAAYVAAVQARGVTDPRAALQALRGIVSEHPPSAPILAAAVLRNGQVDPPSFDAVVTFVAQTIATRTRSGDDALSGFVAFIAAECHEAAARWVADLGIAALREVPDPRYTLDQGQRIRLRDHEKAYREHVEAWRQSPMRGVAVEHARQIDERAGYELPRLHAVPEIGPGA